MFRAAILAIIFLVPTGVVGAPSGNCMGRAAVVDWLKSKYDEEPVLQGVSGLSLFEVFASPVGQTWTLIVTHPNGLSCLVGSGTDFEAFAPPNVSQDGDL